MMNAIDARILVDAIGGTLPAETNAKLTDYFNETALISYKNEKQPIDFLIIFKPTTLVELQSISLVSSKTNVKQFRVDLIDDDKSIVQTLESDTNLTVRGMTEVGVAAIRITYLETDDQQAPRNIRLSIRGCFVVLSTKTTTTSVTETTTTAEPPRIKTKVKGLF
jgi:hypothetical protein